jgi:hypothetical protein
VHNTAEEQKKGTQGISLRVPNGIVDTLKHDADNKKISLNTLANQIFSNYVDWDMTAANAGWVVIQRDTIKGIFNAIDDKTLQDIALPAADALVDALLLMTGQHTLEAFYHILKYRIAKSNFFLTELREKGNVRKLVIQHDLGSKWSLFFKTYYERVLNNLGYAAKSDYTSNTLVLTITEE